MRRQPGWFPLIFVVGDAASWLICFVMPAGRCRRRRRFKSSQPFSLGSIRPTAELAGRPAGRNRVNHLPSGCFRLSRSHRISRAARLSQWKSCTVPLAAESCYWFCHVTAGE